MPDTATTDTPTQTPDSPPSPVSTPEPAATAAPGAPQALSALLSEEYAGLADKYADANEMAKALTHSQQKLSSQNRVELPTQDSTPEDRAAFFNRLGRPDTPDGYEVPPIPEDFMVRERPEAQLQDFLTVAHEEGLSAKQVARLAEWHAATTNTMHIASMEAMRAAGIDAEATLKKEWGDSYDQKIAFAKDAIRTFDNCTDDCPEGEYRQFLIESGGTNDPRVIRYHAAAGLPLAEDVFHRGGTGPITVENSPAEALEKLATIRKDPAWLKAFNDQRDPKHAEVVAQRDALMAEAYPEETATG